ncbi:MAG: general secretion pathway protein GspK [Bdellovibrionales bacterium]|nr:general secretion pathway protein GspK [Bdellovibrionales bacterium]
MTPTLLPHRKNESGVALIMVLMSLALLTVLSVELIAASRIDLRIARNARDRVQALYLAQSSARMAMLRFRLYKQVRDFKDGAGAGMAIPGLTPQVLDGIWSFPLPNLPLDAMTEAKWPGKITSVATSEGSKIPINLLDANPHRRSSKEVAETVQKQFVQLIEGMLQDEEFDKLYRGLRVDDLINPVIDWIDADNDAKSGGDELRYYDRQNPPYRPRNDRIPKLSELYMLENWNDDLVKRIAPHLSALNTSLDINPNYVSVDRLKIWEPKLTNEDLAYISVKRREQNFETLDDLAKWIQGDPDIKGGRTFKVPPELKPTTRETVFYVEASGIVGDLKRTLKLGVRFPEELSKDPKDKNKPGKLQDPLTVSVEEVL